MATTTPNQTALTPIQKVQYNLSLWNDLLQASGGSLNLSKCVWFYFNWKQDAQGTIKIVAPPTNSQSHSDPYSTKSVITHPSPAATRSAPLSQSSIHHGR